LPKVPVLELDKGQAHVLAPTGKAKARHGNNPFHRFCFLLEKMLFQLPYDLDGPLLGGAGRQLDLADDESLILVRQERGGKMHEEEGHGGHNGAVDHQVAHRLAKGAADDSLILVPAELESPVEVAEEPGKPAC